MPTNESRDPDLWTEEPPDFEIKDGIARVRVVSGGREINFRCTPHVLLAGSSKAMAVYVEWDSSRPEIAALPQFRKEFPD